MPCSRRDGVLCLGGLSLAELAERYGTPAYVYSWDHIEAQLCQLREAFQALPADIHYAVKANSNLSLLSRLADEGCGFDVVSGGELERVLGAGGVPGQVVFSGVGKSEAELRFAIKSGIACINIESASELRRIRQISAPISVRVNPDIDARTHPYTATALRTSKFGVSESDSIDLYHAAAADPHLKTRGSAVHLGSQICSEEPFVEALAHLLSLVDRLASHGIELQRLSLGGGFGIPYRDENPFPLKRLAEHARERFRGRTLRLGIEPGRFLVGKAGILLCRVEYLKRSRDGHAPNYAVVDAATTELIRPALYGAWHAVEEVSATQAPPLQWTIVGSVCESSDVLAADSELAIEEGSLWAIRNAGAYGFSLRSNYNTRLSPPELLIDRDRVTLVRSRESMSHVLKLERVGS